MKKLNRLQIIGIILSFLWVTVTSYNTYNSVTENATNLSNKSYDKCVSDQNLKVVPLSFSCLDQKTKNTESFSDHIWSLVFFTALLPLPFVWLYAFILLTIIRCFRYGGKTVLSFDELSIWQKTFGYFCYVFTALTLVLFLRGLMTLYTELKIPVQFGYQKNFSQIQEFPGNVIVKGTWTISTKEDFIKSVYEPIQTSLIKCNLTTKKCIESVASIYDVSGDNHMRVDQKEYNITSWSNNTIIFNNNSTCSTSIFTLDINLKTLNGIKKFNNSLANSDYCKKFENEQDIYFKLEDGLVVRKDLIREASPWLLQVMNSFLLKI